MDGESPRSPRLFSFISGTKFKETLVLAGTVLLLALGVINVGRYIKRTNSIDYLSQEAFSEVRSYWRTRKGSDPQKRWWPFFWKLSEESERADVRERAAGIALTMLANMGEWDKVNELTSRLEPQDPILERSFSVIGKAYSQKHGESAYIGFLSQTIRNHASQRLRAKAALTLARLLIEQARYEAARAVLSAFDVGSIRDEALEKWWNAALFEAEHLRPGMRIPPFALRAADGRSIVADDLTGSPFVFLFWRPTCGPSSLLLDAMYTSPPAGIKVVAISEKASDSEDGMQPRSGFQLVYDKELAREWNVYATPTALLFNRDGRLVGKVHAAQQLAELINSPRGKER